jgi:hypothetical protein
MHGPTATARRTALRGDDAAPLVRPYTSRMPPLSLPPLPPMARFLFGDGGEPPPEADDAGHAPADFEDMFEDMGDGDGGPKHRRPGPARVAGPGELPRHAQPATGRSHE